MATASIPRIRKVHESQYLGDLAGLFERQRRRNGVALTAESFASDLTANDSLRSGLFTLCNAISHMGQDDLPGEELLGLVARALGGAGNAEGEAGGAIPESMRAAFLNGYKAWSNRDLEIREDDAWPPKPGARERKPPARAEPAVPETTASAQMEATSMSVEAASAVAGQRGRHTLQQALGLVRRDPVDGGPPDAETRRERRVGDLDRTAGAVAGGEGREQLGGVTLGELKAVLEEIEERVSRLQPQLQRLTSVVHPAARPQEPPSTREAGPVLSFPLRQAKGGAAEGPAKRFDGFDLEEFARQHSAPVGGQILSPANPRQEDDRPRGIDALLAAAPVWANGVRSSRAFDEDSFLARHAYLAPSRRPGGDAPALLVHGAAAIALPVAAVPVAAATAIAPVATAPAPAETAAQRSANIASALIGLDAEDDPLLSPMERLQAALLRVHPRQVFFGLASLTVLAGLLAGVIAYHTVHAGRLPEFKDIAPPTRFGAEVPAAPVPDAASAPKSAKAPARATAAKPAAPASAAGARLRPNASGSTAPAAAVWPPPPADLAAATAAPQAAMPARPAARPAAAAHGADPPFVSATTMMGYAIATPAPVYPAATANGASGTVTLEITVSRLGDVTGVHALSGPPELWLAAMQAARMWRFRPYLVSGKATEVTTIVQFVFTAK